MDFIEGVVRCKGIPGAACGAKVEMSNAGWPFDGSFIITKVFQEYTFAGLKTEITFKSNSLPKEP